MTKELRQLLADLEAKKTEVRSLMGEGKIEDAERRMGEVRDLQRKIELQKQVDGLTDDEARGGRRVTETREGQEREAEYTSIFYRALRGERVTDEQRSVIKEYRTMHAGGMTGDPDGNSAIIVPQDVQTRINTIMRTLNDLGAYARYEGVTTLTGSRVLEKDEDMTPLPTVAEGAGFGNLGNPKFDPVSYALVKRGGILPVTNELLTTSDANVAGYLATWFAKKYVVTKNSLIIALLNTLAKVAIADFDALKKVLNVDLDPAISLAATVLTNQDGYHWMDTQKDGDGRPLLTDDITQPGRKLFKGRPVAVASNKMMPSDTTVGVKAPMVIGKLDELLVHFSLGRYALKSTDVGAGAFETDTTKIRILTFDDMKKWDAAAVVFGQITISA